MPIKFNCPACSTLIEYDGRSNLFQTCNICKAPIVIPADVINQNPQPLNSSFEITDPSYKQINISSGVQTQDVVISQIYDLLNQKRTIEAIKIYREKFGVDLRTAKEVVDRMVREKDAVFKVETSSENDAQLAGIKSEIINGRKIDAIKLYLETYKVGLKEAKDAVDALENEINSHPVNSKTANEFSSFILDGIKNELRKGNKINAIKIFREHFEISLAISKDIVEAIERGENVDLSQFPKNLN